ncbi:MAG: FadR/GntR family transcriptional regulator [Planctomycetaceae bacterium]
MLKSLPKTKIRDVVVERLKSHIIAEGLMPGDRLPNEADLAEMFGVSRLSLREATKSLELLGIVESKTGVGLSVGHIDIARIAGHLGFHPALQRTPLSQLVDTRVIVETGALPYAFLRMADDPKILETLQNIVDQFRIARDLQEWVNLDLLFHRTLLSASGLTPLVAFNEVLEIFFQRFRDSVKSAEWSEAVDRHQRTIDSHQRIIDALRAQDVQLACRELRQHIEDHLVKGND